MASFFWITYGKHLVYGVGNNGSSPRRLVDVPFGETTRLLGLLITLSTSMAARDSFFLDKYTGMLQFAIFISLKTC
ncbi:hypothetical protein Pint_22830 [Pistacia integerrima]|uniref:Uncharacterized protein n=1 Tax=Pistacia integerrima TaxID=434235 RepID=A0ACC0YMM1_9ROSI|nr:hypothetical protein Pint_22830 [Pistacia integerrima]